MKYETRRRITAVTLFVFFALCAEVGNAASSIDWSKITKFKVTTGGVLIRLEGFTPADPSVLCPPGAPERGGELVLADSAPDREARNSAPLAAFLNDRQVHLSYSSCESNGHLAVPSISLETSP